MVDIMKIEDILYLELDGLTKTIMEYTRDNYIISYSQKLCKLKFPEDKTRINTISGKLIEWYKDNIDDIKSNHYLPSVSAHMKSIGILKTLYKLTL